MANIFDEYKFRCSSLGKIMPGVPKPLTANQQSTFDKLQLIRDGVGERLTPKQRELMNKLGEQFAKDEKPLTDKQVITYNELMLKAQTPVSLSDSQIILYGDLLARKTAKPILTSGVKKYLTKLVWEHLSNRSTYLQNKYLTKGNVVEEKSMTAYANQKDSLILKNQDTKENDYISGTCDIARYKIRDIKSSWNWQTFPLTEDTIPTSDYEWQLDGYMWLWQLQRGELIYCLVDTPFDLVDDEVRKLDWKYKIMSIGGEVKEECIDLVVEVVSGLIYTFKGLEEYCAQSTQINLEWFVGRFKEVPEEIRVKVFQHNMEEERIDQLKIMIELAREYMNKIVDEIGDNAFILHEAVLK